MNILKSCAAVTLLFVSNVVVAESGWIGHERFCAYELGKTMINDNLENVEPHLVRALIESINAGEVSACEALSFVPKENRHTPVSIDY